MATKTHKKHRGFSLGILCFLCLFVAAEPVRIANASFTKSNTMACCAGKTASHCASGIVAKKVRPPKSEPMCGLHGAAIEADGITVVAEPTETAPQHSHSQTTSSHPAAESASLSKPCHMDCSSCAATSTRQQQRERNLLQLTTYHNSSLTTVLRREDQPLLFSSNEEWGQIHPRGPPSDLR